MRLIKTTMVNGEIYQQDICKVPETLFSSVRALKMFLETHATRELGENARVIRNPQGCIVPLHAFDPNTGDTLHIE